MQLNLKLKNKKMDLIFKCTYAQTHMRARIHIRIYIYNKNYLTELTNKSARACIILILFN